MNKTRVLFMGTPLFAAESLKALIDADSNVVGVISQPDKKVGRGQNIEKPPTKVIAENNGIPVFQPNKTEELKNIIETTNPDITVVAAYGKILPEEILNIPRFGTINVHGSLLPKYRGASCVAQAILEGEKETGVTIMKVVKRMDAGAIYSQINVGISDNETTESLTSKLARKGAMLLVETLPKIVNGDPDSLPQTESLATYCKLIQKEDGKIDWNQPAENIERMIRAYTPWPKAFTTISGKRLNILESKIVNRRLKAGKFLIENDEIFVGTGKDSLQILCLQLEGKNPMTAKEFLNGYKRLLDPPSHMLRNGQASSKNKDWIPPQGR